MDILRFPPPSYSSDAEVTGDGFVAINIRFMNGSPLEGNQAVALAVNSDMSALYNCTIQSFQVQ